MRKDPRTSRYMHLKWLGWQDSNLRMPGSKPGALPLGDTPTVTKLNLQNHQKFGARYCADPHHPCQTRIGSFDNPG